MAYDLGDIILVTSDTGVSGSEDKLTEAYDWNVAKGFNVIRYSGALPSFEDLLLLAEGQSPDPDDVIILANPYIKFDETAIQAEGGLNNSAAWALPVWRGDGDQLSPLRDVLYGSWWLKYPFALGLSDAVSSLLCGPQSDGGMFNQALVDAGYSVISPIMSVRTSLTFVADLFPWLGPQYVKAGAQYNPPPSYLPQT